VSEASFDPTELFPYSPRPHQLDLVTAVRDTVLEEGHLTVESPTGTGKTVCALAGCLPAAIERDLRVLYLTRTNAQQRQVILELRAINQRREVFGTGIQGRVNMCFMAMADPELSSASSEELSRFCADRKAHTREGGAKDPMACPYFARLIEWDTAQTVGWAMRELPTAPELIAYCRERGICAHEVAKELLRNARVVTAPYIYFFAPFARRRLLEWMACHESDLVVVVDEAHNLPDYTRDLQSLKLTLETLKRARREASELEDPEVAEDLRLSAFLEGLEAIVMDLADEYVVDEDGLIPPDAFSAELMTRFRATSNHLMVIARNLVTHGEILRDQRRRLGRLARSYLHAVGLFVEAYLDLDAEEYVKLAASPQPAEKGATRESWLEGYCMDPSKACAALHDTAASVHMSGTLRPLEEYRASIGLPEGARLLALPSPFPKENRHILYAQDLTTRYEDLQRDPSMVERIEDRTVTLVNSLARNTVVFFPSFAMKQRFILDGAAGRITPRVYDEERGMPTASLEGLLEDFKQPACDGNCLFAVVGGRVSEGLDFPGPGLEVAVVVGIPYPKPTARQKAMRHYYEVKFGRGWDYAVKAPTTRKLLQAVGRLIRSETDMGVAVVMDSRAAQFKGEVPELRQSYDVVGDAKTFLDQLGEK
jgi:DNA excision repair protein ERCC-2